MSIGNAILNQALSRGAGELKKVMGNLPGSALAGSKPAFGMSANMPQSINLQYPLNVEGDIQQGHYIMFFINSTKQVEIKRHVKALSAYNKDFIRHQKAVDFGAETQIDAPKETTLSSAPVGAMAVRRPSSVRLERAISLYMPPSVKTTYSSLYSDTEIGAGAALGASLLQDAMQGGKQGMKDLIGLGEKEGTFKKKWKAGGQMVGDAGLATAFSWAKGIETIGGPLFGLQGTMAAAQIASGKIMSDKMELLFTGVGRRKFSYTFTFIPKSEKESEMVANIVFTFKKHMTPSFGSVGFGGVSSNAGGRILNIPETFDIQYMYHSKENPWLNKISTCYLTSMDVQYGSDKAGFYEPLANPAWKGAGVGPPPTHTTMTLNFEEIEKMSRKRIEEGF